MFKILCTTFQPRLFSLCLKTSSDRKATVSKVSLLYPWSPHLEFSLILSSIYLTRHCDTCLHICLPVHSPPLPDLDYELLKNKVQFYLFHNTMPGTEQVINKIDVLNEWTNKKTSEQINE